MNKLCLMLLSLSVFLSACGQTTGGEPSASTETPVSSNEAGQAAEPVGQAEEDAPPQMPEEEQPQAEPAEPEEAEPAYRMNGNYMIVPKDEASVSKVVLLTFDDGPKDREVLTAILDTLDKHEAKAIFFVNGYRVKQNPELLTLIDDRGQTIGNHSWDHVNLKKLTAEEANTQLEDVQTIVEQLTGDKPKFFRPPFGEGNDHVKKKAAEEGMLYMTWSNGSKDWVKGYDKPNKIIESVMDQLHQGSNILMHELPWTAEALDSLLTQLEDKGYGFVNPEQIDSGYSKN